MYGNKAMYVIILILSLFYNFLKDLNIILTSQNIFITFSLKIILKQSIFKKKKKTDKVSVCPLTSVLKNMQY